MEEAAIGTIAVTQHWNTSRHVTNGSTAANGVSYAVCTDSYMQQQRNCGKRRSLWVRA
jgi:hypothetical protein